MHEPLNAPVHARDAWLRPLLIFAQMLPATLLTPAIRPLFASQHAGDERAMHAFMAVNMLAAVIAVPLVGAFAERLRSTRALTAALLALDAALLAALPHVQAVTPLLALRALEGAAHVSVAALLMARAASHAHAQARGRAMAAAGAALMLAVALGSTLGGLLVAHHLHAPFVVGAALEGAVAIAVALLPATPAPSPARRSSSGKLWQTLRDQRELRVPLAAAFVGRFSVGCVIVSFALFAHRAHGISDRSVGMLYTCLTLPFALAMYPLSRLGERISRAALMAAGALTYATALVALGWAAPSALPLVMLAAGLGSAALFSPTLCYAATLGGARRETAMSLVHAAGCLGMLLGPTCAGILSSLAGRVDPIAGYRLVFVLAGASVAVWLLASLPWLAARARNGDALPAIRPAP